MFICMLSIRKIPHKSLWLAHYSTQQSQTIRNDKKPIHTAPSHLQRMLLHLQKYDYTIVYKPGKEIILADHIS